MPRSVAFKCTYNDGESGEYVGLRGTCSRDLIVHNVQTHVWCGQEQSPCNLFFKSGMQGDKPNFPCMESELFEHWRFSGGTWHHGPKAGQDIFVRETATGKIVILTTRKPNQNEAERKIIGAYEIGDIDSGGYLNAVEGYRIRLRTAEANQLDFWRYYKNERDNEPKWGTLLFRYLDEGQVHRILTDMAEVVGESTTRNTVDKLIALKFGDQVAPPAVGALSNQISVTKKVALGRKYPGGEGKEHLALKNWIAGHPAAVGLPANSTPYVEHIFASGDCVDIAFQLPTGAWAVVEIETTQPFPGAHQVVKYRALLAAQRGWKLDTNKVTGILAAWGYEKRVLEFCRRYGIQTWTCRLGELGSLIP